MDLNMYFAMQFKQNFTQKKKQQQLETIYI